jgi:hypothetical protein
LLKLHNLIFILIMGYILKDTEGLVITRLTDVGRRKISQGSFNISYFQVGDSEVNYTSIPNYNQADSMVLEPPYNAQNNSGVPNSTKNNVKYPYYLQGSSGITYGIPYQASNIDEVYNTASPSGQFSATTSCYPPQKGTGYTYNSEYQADLGLGEFDGVTTTCQLFYNPCTNSATGTISANTFVSMYMTGDNDDQCGCLQSCYPILTYRVIGFDGTNLTVDRPFPDLNTLGYTGFVKLFFYPSGMTGYDLATPSNYWSTSVINYESICTPEDGFVKIWNMNIPWSESPAGTTVALETYDLFASKDYIGTKEYYGYMSSSGQTDTSSTFYYDSYGNKVNVAPEDQKTIAIVHYTNNTIINFFGEKFATEAYDATNPGDTGQARNFKITMPWLTWHKNKACCSGTTFYIDPPGFDGYDLLTPYYIQSNKNLDMNNPGIRYFHLYDTNATPNGLPNRVGKVFPDDKIIIFDDEEIVAAMSYASNRNYTLPAPRLGLVPIGVCGSDTDGLLDNDSMCVWVTYGFEGDWQGMHCNYYQKICGPSTATTTSEQNVTVNFGGDFQCFTAGATSGFGGTNFFVLAQTGSTSQSRPSPTGWKKIDFTADIPVTYIAPNNYIKPEGLTATTFTIGSTNYAAGISYDLSTQIYLPVVNSASPGVNFGDEYYFYGTIQTDIEATIYEMRYLINLPNNQFNKSTNPTWNQSYTPYMTEIGLYDTDKNLLVLSKFQSPQVRQGLQQVVVKLDF